MNSTTNFTTKLKVPPKRADNSNYLKGFVKKKSKRKQFVSEYPQNMVIVTKGPIQNQTIFIHDISTWEWTWWTSDQHLFMPIITALLKFGFKVV